VRQTGTRDIQPRIQRILARHGLRTRILPKSLEPAKRDGWIKKHARDIDVLITNPKKVATGLDLIQFSTIVNYEIDYSLFVMWQSIRRVWRLGQTKPVRILFPVYEGTMEEQALTLMGQKMKAALLLYGDNAASAIADEASDAAGDILSELASTILDEERSTGFAASGITSVTGLSGDESGAGSLWDELNDIVEGQFSSTAETETVEVENLTMKSSMLTAMAAAHQMIHSTNCTPVDSTKASHCSNRLNASSRHTTYSSPSAKRCITTKMDPTSLPKS